MFGRDEKSGDAVIVARRMHDKPVRSGINLYPSDGRYSHAYDYVADVTPSDGQPVFRATFTYLFKHLDTFVPAEGDRARVTFRDGNSDVEFDAHDLQQRWDASQQATASSFDAISKNAPGT